MLVARLGLGLLTGCTTAFVAQQPAPRVVDAPRVEPAVTCILPGWDQAATHHELTPDHRFELVLTDVRFDQGNYNSAHGTLLAVPIAGGTPVRLAEDVSQDFALTPDGARVLVRPHGDTRLDAVPIAGGPGVTLGKAVSAYWITPDGQRAVLETVVHRSGTLRTVGIDGRDERILATNVEMPAGLTPDGRYMLFETDWHSTHCTLESVALAGGSPIVLARNVYPEIDLTGDGKRVLVLFDYARASGTGTLASIPVAGGTAVVFGARVRDYKRTADDRRVVFAAKAEGDAMEAAPTLLETTAIDGGAVRELAAGIAIDEYKLARDGHSVVYIGHADLRAIAGEPNARGTLATVGLDGGPARTLSADVHRPLFALTSDGQRAVFYSAYDAVARTGSLDSVRLTDGASTALAAGIDDNAYVLDSMRAGGARLLVSRGHSVSAVAVADAATTSLGTVGGASFSPDGSQIAYIDHPDEHGIGTLTVVSSASGAPRALLRHCGDVHWLDPHHLLAVRKSVDGVTDPQPAGLYAVELR